ncbi:hypothetical protein H2248_005286 [Termitomyces sp. 'cryptogamus']|nr:hypothetical protein H2248_005286 [Termitomyces sp. 'cryptogamus']
MQESSKPGSVGVTKFDDGKIGFRRRPHGLHRRPVIDSSELGAELQVPGFLNPEILLTHRIPAAFNNGSVHSVCPIPITYRLPPAPRKLRKSMSSW